MSRHPSSLPILLLSIVVLLPAIAGAASPCDPDDAVRAILDEERRLEETCDWSAKCVEERQALLEKGLREHPGDVHLHRALQDLYRYPDWQGEEIDTTEIEARYQRLLEEHPDDPLYLYLHGRLVEGEDARPFYERALAADPGFPWAYLGLTYLELYEGEVDQDAAKEHVARFLDLCPASMGLTASYVRKVEDPAFWRRRLAAAEAASSEAPAEYGHYRPIWELEFRKTPPGEHAALRQRIRADLERLERLDRRDDKDWWKALRGGYELVGDAEKMARAEQGLLALDPCDATAMNADFRRWQDEHPRPDESAADEERSAWRRQRYAMTREWVERCPGHFSSEEERFSAAAELESVPDDELAAAGDGFLAAFEEDRGTIFMSPSPYYLVAFSYLEHDGLVDRIPGLLEKARGDADATFGRFPEEARLMFAPSHRLEIWEQRTLLTEAYLKLGRLDDVHGQLLALDEDLEEPADDASDEEQGRYRHMAGGYWRLQALLAEAEERRLDAVVYYRNAHRFSDDDKHLERAAELWREAGGGGAAWLAWSYDSPDLEQASPWKEKGEPLAELELADLAGKTWRRGDFAGKTVFANIWATWCGPCRKELPFVQELYERLRDDPKTLVVTLNIDRNVGLVAPFMEKNELTFPVLLGEDWVRGQLDSVSIPRNWLIDAEGTLRKEQRGFDSQAELEAWIGEVMAEISGLSGP